MPRTTTEFFSIFGQIESVVASAMIEEGAAIRIEPEHIPETALYNKDGDRALFAIQILSTNVHSFERRIRDLRA